MVEWLLWTDIETTGLDVSDSKILQIACVLTNFDLTVQYCLPEMTIYYQNSELEKMDAWCKEQHTKSGLLNKVYQSDLHLKDAEERIVNVLNQHVSLKDTVYIAGNSVHFDKRFIDYYLPNLSKRLSHRIVDITSFSLIYKHFCPDMHSEKPIKTMQHTAQQDIFESITEYEYYLHFIKNTDNHRVKIKN